MSFGQAAMMASHYFARMTFPVTWNTMQLQCCWTSHPDCDYCTDNTVCFAFVAICILTSSEQGRLDWSLKLRFRKTTNAFSSINYTGWTCIVSKINAIWFGRNFVNFALISILFHRKIAKKPNSCEMHTFSASPDVYHHTTVANLDILICDTMM